jgi:hypothetical protein
MYVLVCTSSSVVRYIVFWHLSASCFLLCRCRRVILNLYSRENGSIEGSKATDPSPITHHRP